MAVVASGLSQNPSLAISASISWNRFSWLTRSKILLELVKLLFVLSVPVWLRYSWLSPPVRHQSPKILWRMSVDSYRTGQKTNYLCRDLYPAIRLINCFIQSGRMMQPLPILTVDRIMGRPIQHAQSRSGRPGAAGRPIRVYMVVSVRREPVGRPPHLRTGRFVRQFARRDPQIR
jgi:hypothetical protein